MERLTWRRVLVFGCLLASLGAVAGGAIQLLARGATTALLLSAGVHSVRTNRELKGRPWKLMMTGGAIALVGAVVRAGLGLASDDPYPYPSYADVLTVAAYVFMFAGGASLVRARTIERRREDIIDAAIAATASALLLLSLFFHSYLTDATEPLGERLLSGVYLILMVATIGLLVRAAAGPGERNSSYYLLAMGTVLLVLNDFLVRFHAAGIDWALGAAQRTAPFAFVMAAASMLHPQAVRLTDRPLHVERGLSARRLVLSLLAMLVGPVLLGLALNDVVLIDTTTVLTLWTALALLVLARMVGLVRSKEASAARAADLRHVASQLATAAKMSDILDLAVAGGRGIVGVDARVVLAAPSGTELRVLRAGGRRADAVDEAIPVSSLPSEVVEALEQAHTVVLEQVAPFDLQTSRTDMFVLTVPIDAGQRSYVLIVTGATVFTREQVGAMETLASQVSLALLGVTAREQSHIRRSNRRFRALVENASDIVLVLDGDAQVSFASPTVGRLLGRDERQVLEKPLLDIVHRPDQLHVRRIIAAPSRQGGPHSSVEVRLLHGSGELRWFEMEARDLTGEDEVRGIVITARDVSDRRRAEAQLLRSEARFRLMVQNSSDVVAIVDDNNMFTYVSPSIERMLGFAPAEVLGRNVFELLSITEAERLRGVALDELQGTLEVRVQGVDGRVRAIEVGVTDMRDQPEVDGIVLNIRDVTERKSLEDDLRHQALHDDLTGLANRALFTERVRDAKRLPNRDGGMTAVLFIDLDDFKLINDSLGHVVGDQVLVAVADRIQQCLRLSDVAARLGGDEFAVLLTGVYGESEIIEVAERVRNSIGEPLRIADNDFRITASIGVVADSDGSQSDDDLLRSADLAMYQAKQSGKDRYELFQTHMAESAFEELELKTALTRALEHGEFVVHYQPIVELATSRIAGVEALIRWEDPSRGMVSPAAFIPTAEETGLIRPIGMWVAEQAASDLATWRAAGFDLYCSINVSSRQLGEEGFAAKLIERVGRSGVDPSKVVVELTESVLADQGASGVFDAFHDVGFRVALDDFGTGYSAFQYLQTFDIDLIKIDRSFVQAMHTDADAGVVEAVIDVARRIDAATVAEGIEDSTELRALKQLGVEFGQGYYFSRPVPAEKIQALLEAPIGAGLSSRAVAQSFD